MSKIYLSSPHMSDEGYELEYIKKAFDENWIAPLGSNVNLFEEKIANYIGSKFALATSSGTAAIHLALKCLSINENDYVFCSDLTFVASCNPILYEKAIPVFIDSDESCNMSPKALENAFKYFEKNMNKMPKAVIVVDLYGHPAKWIEIKKICKKYNVPIIEDAAEALGAKYNDRYCGTFGDIGVFSFNGNKLITSSGGGMLVCNDKSLRDYAFFLATQAKENRSYYHHETCGYNYRMSNICAGIGLGQLHVIDKRIEKKRQLAFQYKEVLKKYPVSWIESIDDGFSTYWLTCCILDEGIKVTDIIKYLSENNIESRHIWKPMHLQPLYKNNLFFEDDSRCWSEYFYYKGLCLPSDTKIDEKDFNKIVTHLKEVLI